MSFDHHAAGGGGPPTPAGRDADPEATTPAPRCPEGAREARPEGRLTVVTSTRGAVNKRFRAGPDGAVVAEPTVPLVEGKGGVLALTALELAAALDAMTAEQVVVLGVPRGGAEQFFVTTEGRERPGEARDGRPVIARTKRNFVFPDGPAWLLLDYDTDGMDDDQLFDVEMGPGVLHYHACGHVRRASASAGLVGRDGREGPASRNRHDLVLVADGSDIPRVAEALFVRSCLAGDARVKVARSGAVLVRGLFDLAAAKSPERLSYEGDTPLADGVTRRTGARRAVAHDGPAWDTRAAVPDLTDAERRAFAALAARLKAVAAPEAAKLTAEHHRAETARLVASGVPEERARRAVEARAGGVLLGPDLIRLDDGAEVRVADVLGDPARFHHATCHDPFEPGERNKAVLFVDDRPQLFSHRHGGGTFPLRHSPETAVGAAGRGGEGWKEVLRVGWRPADPIEEEAFAAAVARGRGSTKAAAQRAVRQELRRLPPLPGPRREETLEELLATLGDLAADEGSDDPIAGLNRDHFVAPMGGSVVVVREEEGGGRRLLMSPEGFRLLHANRRRPGSDTPLG